MSWRRTVPRTAAERRIDELLLQPCLCEQLPHSCDRCKELADAFEEQRRPAVAPSRVLDRAIARLELLRDLRLERNYAIRHEQLAADSWRRMRELELRLQQLQELDA